MDDELFKRATQLLLNALGREDVLAQAVALLHGDDTERHTRLRVAGLERRMWLRSRLLTTLGLEAQWMLLQQQQQQQTQEQETDESDENEDRGEFFVAAVDSVLREISVWCERQDAVIADTLAHARAHVQPAELPLPITKVDIEQLSAHFVVNRAPDPLAGLASDDGLQKSRFGIEDNEFTAAVNQNEVALSMEDANLTMASSRRNSVRPLTAASTETRRKSLFPEEPPSPGLQIAAVDTRTDYLADTVAVGNPIKVTSALSSYIVYSCVIRKRGSPDLVVHKRFTDFEKLRERLVKAHSSGPNPQVVGMPELPEKKIMGNFKASFVETRRRGLEELLMFVAKNQQLSNSSITREWFATSLPPPT